MGPNVCPHVPLLSIFSAGLPEPAPLASNPDAGRGHRFSTVHQCIPEVWQSGAPARTRQFAHYSGPIEVRPEVACHVHSVHLRQGTQAGWVSASSVLLAGGTATTSSSIDAPP